MVQETADGHCRTTAAAFHLCLRNLVGVLHITSRLLWGVECILAGIDTGGPVKRRNIITSRLPWTL
eukprot:7786228-Pyramimonas_sp.AAC.1